MILHALLFGGVLGCYLVASVCYHVHLFTGSARARQVAPFFLGAGVLLHALALGERWFDPAAPRLSPSARATTTIAWLIALAQLVLHGRQRWAATGSLAVPIAFAAVFYANAIARETAGPVGLLRTPLMSLHLIAIILGFAGFALAFCMAVIYLVQSWLLKHKQLRGPFERLPPLESVATAAHWLAVVGFSMLTLGIITGVLWAMERGGAWYLEPRVLASFVAWLIYGGYLTASVLGGWRGRRTTYFLIGGFAVVLVAYVVNLR